MVQTRLQMKRKEMDYTNEDPFSNPTSNMNFGSYSNETPKIQSSFPNPFEIFTIKYIQRPLTKEKIEVVGQDPSVARFVDEMVAQHP